MNDAQLREQNAELAAIKDSSIAYGQAEVLSLDPLTIAPGGAGSVPAKAAPGVSCSVGEAVVTLTITGQPAIIVGNVKADASRGVYEVEAELRADDDIDALIRALDKAYRTELNDGFGLGEVLLPSRELVIPSGTGDPVDWADPFAAGDRLIIDAARASFLGHRGTRLQCDDTSGVVCQITAAANRIWGTSSFGGTGGRVGRFSVIGPVINDPASAGTLVGVLLRANDGAVADLAHALIEQLAVSGCFIGRLIGDNAHRITHFNCQTYFNRVGVMCEKGSTNHGERITFRDCLFSNNAIGIANRAAVSMLCDGCSFDYRAGSLDSDDKTALGWAGAPDSCHVFVGDGTTVLHACHLEDNRLDGSHYIAKAEDGNRGGLLRIEDCMAVIGQATNDPWAYSDASCTQTGIDIDGLSVHFAISGGNLNYQHPVLVGGEGRVVGRRVSYQDRGLPGSSASQRLLVYPPVARQLSVIDGSFDTADTLDPWDFALSDAGCTPTRDTATKYSGAGALKFAVTASGERSVAVLPVNAKPGQSILTSWRYKSSQSALGEEVFKINAYFVKDPASVNPEDPEAATAQPIAHFATPVAVQLADDVDGWTLHHGMPVVMPPGVERALLTFFTATDSGGSYLWDAADAAWIDDLIVNVV